jgi:hypothetical protein
MQFHKDSGIVPTFVHHRCINKSCIAGSPGSLARGSLYTILSRRYRSKIPVNFIIVYNFVFCFLRPPPLVAIASAMSANFIEVPLFTKAGLYGLRMKCL